MTRQSRRLGDGEPNMTPEREGKRAAAAFRREHHLGVRPLGDLIALMERTTGHDVAVIDADQDEHGLTTHDPQRDITFVVVARTRNPMRQRSSLAHELAHVVFADWNDGEDLAVRSPKEIRADAFARHLLIPGDGLDEFLGHRETLTDADLSSIVQWFLVSPAIAAIALHDQKYIGAAKKREWMNHSTPHLATRFGWGGQYQSLQNGSDRTRSPQRLLARAIAGYEEGVVTAQTVATLRGISAESAAEELTDAGVVPRTSTPPWMSSSELPSVDVDLSDLDDEIHGNPVE